MANTIWGGNANDKVYLQSGTFTSTIKTSLDYSSVSSAAPQMSYDGTDWYFHSAGVSFKLYRMSGLFTSTVKDSENVNAVDTQPKGISPALGNTGWIGSQADKFYTQSGTFTSTIKTSVSCAGQTTGPSGFELKETDTLWGRQPSPGRIYLQSGQYTTTLKTSLDVSSGFNSPTDVSYTGTDTMWMDLNNDRLVLNSGLSIDDVVGRLGPDTSGNTSITLPQFWLIRNTMPLPIFTLMGLELGANLNGDIDIDLPVLTLNGQASFDDDITVTFPIFTLVGRAYNGSAPKCVVMNTKNFAVSEYDLYGFNSMAKFNGANLVADQNGIYEQDSSDTDNAGVDDYKIKAHIKSGEIDTYSGAIQRPRNMFLDYETDGDVQIVSKGDKRNNRSYYIPYKAGYDGIVERRRKFERGVKDRVFDFKVENIDGSNMEIDKLTVTLEPIVSKRR
jgi:hypothetical protein